MSVRLASTEARVCECETRSVICQAPYPCGAALTPAVTLDAQSGVYALAVLPDGGVVSGQEDGAVRAWR